MSGTRTGGLKSAEANKKYHGKDFYKVIGRLGGERGHTGGFYYSKVNGLDWHKEAGRRGGKISKRTKKGLK